MMPLRARDIKVGDIYEECLVKDLERTQIVQYAGASGDYNAMHIDEVYAAKVLGYPSVFAHGMLTMGMTGKMLTHYVGDGRLSKYGVRFTRQVFPGDDLMGRATVTEIRREAGKHYVELAVETVNQNGEVVISGRATARIDP